MQGTLLIRGRYQRLENTPWKNLSHKILWLKMILSHGSMAQTLVPREGGAGSGVPACAHEQPTQPRSRSVPITPGRTPGTSRGSQVVTRTRPPKCAMGTGGWCSYGASDEHQEAQDLVELARRQPLWMRGFAGSRRGCVRVGAMEEREQRRRCRGQNEAGERGLLQEAAGGIPRALAMTDGRVVHGAAEA